MNKETNIDDYKEKECCNKCNCGDDCKCHNDKKGCCKNNTKNDKTQCSDNDLLDSEDVDVSNDVLYYLELAQRTKADFDNYKRRNADIAKTSYENGLVFAVEKLIPVIDGITQAKLSIKDEATLNGFEIINTQFLNSLTNLGVTKIESLGKKFDPNFHNAVLTGTEEDIEDDIVLEEYQQGFMLKDKVIRHSVVKINKLS